MNVIIVNGTQARTFDGVEPFVTGQSNFDKVEFRFDNAWDGMTKIAQFVQGSNRYNVAVENNECTCPSELVKGCVFVRVRGYSATDVIATANEIQIPVEQGFEPGGVPPVPPTPDLYQKLLGTVQDQIGDLDALKTEDKSSLVAAINEVQETGGGGTADHAKLKNRDAADQHPMSAITGLVDALAGKQPTGDYLTEELDPTVPEWAKQPQKPAYTAQEVGALPATTRIPSTAVDVNAEPAGAVSQHNVSDAAHSDLRLIIQGLSERLSAVADSDDTTLDQLSEIVAYIKSNRDLISAITTSKVNVADIVDNLTTNVANKPLSAAQGVALKALIDALTEEMPEAYTLPIASSTQLGGVQPAAKTDAMTQSVGVDADGTLWTEPGSGGGSEEAGYKDAVNLLDVTLDDTTGGLKYYEYDVSGIEKTDVIIINILFPASYSGVINIKNQSNAKLTDEFPNGVKGIVVGLKVMNGRYLHSAVYSSNTSARFDAPLSLFYGQINGASGFERPKARDAITKIKFALSAEFASGTRIRIYRW